MDNKTTTFERINKCLLLCGAEATDVNQSFIEDLQMDSLDCLEMSLELEEEFGIDIPDADIEDDKIKTVKQLVDYLDDRLQPDGN